ncbi:hypothetical protein [Nonomuraea sp. SYSU D8015]|uniref:hypothetical protein n=1 Tax=Nonomuraea sp. SYSU D8015 TaxID=2593644 RepID=UPI0016607E9D|nr:hypothetical protein [Nonomuraea sp. SYSU D8015]
MTIEHVHDTEQADVAEVVEETDLIVAILRGYMVRERKHADQYASEASRARARATDLEKKAMECRDRQRRWERLLKLDAAGDDLLGELVNDRGDAQTMLVPRPRQRFPLAHSREWGNIPHLACIFCGGDLGEATAADVEAVLAGDDVQPKCDDCKAAAERGGNPYPAPPKDAA